MYVGSLHGNLGGCWYQREEDEPQDQEGQEDEWQQDKERHETKEGKSAEETWDQ